MNPEHLHLAFANGSTKLSPLGTPTRFSTKELPPLIVSSGYLVACDPLVCPDLAPFSLQVPSGVYSVTLAIAHIDTDQRVAYAKIEFSQSPIDKWQMATLPNQDVSWLQLGEAYGYGVDSGTGCFADVAAMQALQERMDTTEDYFEELIAECDKTYVHTWSWANIEFQPKTKSNLLMFSTGYGDGFYTSWFGFTNDGRVAALVTDFDVLYDEPDEIGNGGKRQWWQFWK